jgi:hypothetical protein
MLGQHEHVAPRVVAADEVEEHLRSLVGLLREAGHVVVATETDLGASRHAIDEVDVERSTFAAAAAVRVDSSLRQ